MNNTNTGGPAFPQTEVDRDGLAVTHQSGMTLRDYFAASFVSSGHVFTCISPGDTPELVAQQAYMMADAMLKARNA
jgi:hypothetical protein